MTRLDALRALEQKVAAGVISMRDFISLTKHKTVIVGSGCWVWRGTASVRGVPVGTKGSTTDKSLRKMAWEAHAGRQAPGAVEMTCSTPMCFCPQHTRIMRVGARIGHTQPKDGSRFASTFDNGKIADIRRRWDSGQTQKLIADCYGVHPSTISRILHSCKPSQGD